MNAPKTSRRRFLRRLGLIGGPVLLLAGADAHWVEPHRLIVRRVRLTDGESAQRFAFFADLHYKGDKAYTQKVVAAINAEHPDFVIFGGDLIEKEGPLKEALELLSGIQAPLCGVPGNHDFFNRGLYQTYRAGFAATGGVWLMNEHRDLAGGKIRLIGLDCNRFAIRHLPVAPQAKNIVLVHYPAWANLFPGQSFDLMLAGHSHGGQVRLPWIGPLILPTNVGRYDMGRYATASGPLYVNPGIGWLHVDVRFNCPPEVTIFEI